MWRLLSLLVDHEAVRFAHERPVVRVKELLVWHFFVVLVRAEAVDRQRTVRIGRGEQLK